MNLEGKEKQSEKKTFWQRFRAGKQEKVSTRAVGIQSLVKKVLIRLIDYFFAFQFRYAGAIEFVCLVVAIIASAVFGVALPLSLIVLGDAIDSFINRASNLCSLNLTSLSGEYCPPHVTLTSINFYTTMT